MVLAMTSYPCTLAGLESQKQIWKTIIFSTLPETNIFAPENGWLEYYFPIGMTYF